MRLNFSAANSSKEGRDLVREILVELGDGCVFRGWRSELDRDGQLEVGYQGFCAFAERHRVKVDTYALLGQDADVSSMALAEVCPKTGALIARLQRWVKNTFGGPVELFLAMDAASEGRVASDAVGPWCRARGFEATDAELAAVGRFVDVDRVGTVTRDDLVWLEPDRATRKAAVQRLRLSRREQHQQILASVYSDEHRRLPPTHRLAPRPWQAGAFEKLPVIVHERRGNWRREVLRREQEAKELFIAHLKDACGNLVRAWRSKLDPDNSSFISQAGLKRYCSKAGIQTDVAALWRALDVDRDEVFGLESLCPEVAEILASFRQWAWNAFGSCSAMWDQPEVVDARSAPQKGGRWRSEKKMLLAAFSAVLKDFGWSCKSSRRGASPATVLFNSLDLYGCGFVSRSDLEWLDTWRHSEWLTAEPDAEEWAIMKALLVRVEGHALRAWRKRLDVDDSNNVCWAEFRQAFEALDFHGNIAGAWRHVDKDMSGAISMKEYDAESSQLLSSFKDWAERNFGSVYHTLKALDLDGSESISRSELRKACNKRMWNGDVDLLFQCLDTDGERDKASNKLSLSAAEISFLDSWQAAELPPEDEEDLMAPSASKSKRGGRSAAQSAPAQHRSTGSTAPAPRERRERAPVSRSASLQHLPPAKTLPAEFLPVTSPMRESALERPLSSPRVTRRPMQEEGTPLSRRPPPAPRRRSEDREQRIQLKEHRVQSVYNVLAHGSSSDPGSAVSSSAVTDRLHPKKPPRQSSQQPPSGYPRSQENSQSRLPQSMDGRRLPRSKSCAAALNGGAGAEGCKSLTEIARSGMDLGSKFSIATDPGDLVYRLGRAGHAVAPFSLTELKLNPLGGQDFSRGVDIR
eukprot:gb/GFBE01033153.1/.p1 GENE.gb/GFBE01033153.1/~~gb/GFBE01033153.1/.p1  ORF type:complete len:863 (+),score=145.30 gb/GFBE01033153.1/:1-2589(+)